MKFFRVYEFQALSILYILTGRRDSRIAFADLATEELPSHYGNLSKILASFASRGFNANARETVSLFGAHSIGVIHCKFFQNRLYNFGGTHEPDPSMDPEFLELMRLRCNSSLSTSSWRSKPYSVGVVVFRASASPSYINGSLSSSTEEPEMAMDYDRPGSAFGTFYFRSLLQGKGILHADQQLIAGAKTRMWVRAYASDASLFRRDFSLATMKLANLQVLTAPMSYQA